MEKVRLGDLLLYEQPTKYLVESDMYDDSYEVPVLTAGKSFLLGYTDEKENIFENVPVIIFDDFTTSTQFVDFPFKVKSSAMKILNCNNEKADIRYMFYLLQTIKIDSERHKRYWISQFAKMDILLPSLSVQQAIAAQLDQARELVQYHHQLLEKYDELQQSLFLEMFGDPVLNEKGWERKRLEEVAEIIMGQSPKGTSYNEEGIGSPLLNGPTEFGEKYPIEKQWTTEPKKFSKKGDILFCVRGATAGRMNWSDKEYCIGRGLAAIRPLKNISFGSDYLYKFLEGMYQVFQETSDGSTFINISSKDLRSIKIPNVPLSLQNEFASYIESIEYQKSLVREALQQSEDVFNGLLQESFG